MGDCGTDVTLNRTLDVAKTCIKDYLTKTVGFSLLLEVQASEHNDYNASIGTTKKSRVVQGGRLVATYLLASMGELDYHSNLKYTPTAADSEDQIKAQDISVVQSLREAIRSEVDLLDNGTRKFGMVMLNRHRRPQGDLGHIHFMQYGTLVHIEHAEMLGDGRFMLETRGTSRFRVLETSVLDGYNVGRIERVDDLPIAQEEAIEARETANVDPLEEDPVAKIEHMSTQQLLEYCLAFVENARSRSAPWLHRRILRTYGEPPSDPALFPYWLACILPIADEQKYPLLAATSVRERLKIAARWVQRLEAVVW
ncbi:hypothetical protein DV738_g3611, partial [Chaetothyriales sp. CBS 135597]